MRKALRLLLFGPLWLACQSNDPAAFGIEPNYVAYNDEAPMLKKVFCNDAKCKDPSYEERYTYAVDGKLSKVEIFAKTASGLLELQSYTDYFSDASGLMTGKIQYNRHGFLPGWVAYYESEFEYQNGMLKLEKTYFNQHQPEKKCSPERSSMNITTAKRSARRGRTITRTLTAAWNMDIRMTL